MVLAGWVRPVGFTGIYIRMIIEHFGPDQAGVTCIASAKTRIHHRHIAGVHLVADVPSVGPVNAFINAVIDSGDGQVIFHDRIRDHDQGILNQRGCNRVFRKVGIADFHPYKGRIPGHYIESDRQNDIRATPFDKAGIGSKIIVGNSEIPFPFKSITANQAIGFKKNG